jgi:hypothetical protein
MKMLYFSSEHAEVETLRKELIEAGIPCEVHDSEFAEGGMPVSRDEELWIQRDEDCYRALMLCIHLGAGFGKRAVRKSLLEDEAESNDGSED